MSMVLITSNSRQYLAALGKIPEAMQKVTAATLTETAEKVTEQSQRNVAKKMIVRTPYTTKSIVTYKASATRPIARQDAISGTKSDYLPIQDAGGIIRAKNKRIGVPTNAIRGSARKKKIPARYRAGQTPKAFTMRGDDGHLGLYVRKNKKSMVKIRDLEKAIYTLKATNWHKDAVNKYGNYQYMAKVFERQARKYLKSYT